MNCRETREFLFAFLDNELDAALSLAVQRHLEQCCDCAREAEIERAVREHLSNALAAGSPDAPFDEARVLKSLSIQGSTGVPAGGDKFLTGTEAGATVRVVFPPLLRGGRGGLLWLVCALSLAAAIFLVAMLTGRKPAARDGAISSDVLVDDFERFAAEGEPLNFVSADRAEVSAWILAQVKLPVQLPQMHGKCKLLGARHCRLKGKDAALALYDMEGTRATLLVLAGKQPDVQSAASVRGHTLISIEHEGLTYAAIGDLPGERLAELIPQH